MPDILETTAEPPRRALLQILADGERTVSELAQKFPVTRSAISQHLLLLAEVGLVEGRKVGRNRYYRLNPAGMRGLRSALESFWTSELDLLVTEATGLTS
ncbi:helix-turn-helix transcriptional regulator [Paeniglutamicibacter sp. Y32M11]|uniref:ArsR/SmtB family transcription factor n=1 Tax=Paeniglutamicibacter sp. Y32M11 TaxID=2853258 RepID=UPI002107CFCC|nr:metalloregulator ArsR/SmtB family transcription factor [Paeniglutamicibacter sp. Y32M11]